MTMDYEKKYKEALEWARKVMQGEVGFVLDEVLEKFPELKESDDERIREWIIDDIRYNMNNEPLNNSEYKKNTEKAIAWLEKQNEQKHISDFSTLRTWKYIVDAVLTEKEGIGQYLASLQLTEEEIIRIAEEDKLHGIEKVFARDYLTMGRCNISTRKANQLATMFDYYQNGIAQQKIVGTAWGAYNAVTGYYSNVDNKEGSKRLDSLMWGSANANMNKALNEVFEYAEAV